MLVYAPAASQGRSRLRASLQNVGWDSIPTRTNENTWSGLSPGRVPTYRIFGFGLFEDWLLLKSGHSGFTATTLLIVLRLLLSSKLRTAK
jgi:hypothetical protein